jgi:hypothetical protein
MSICPLVFSTALSALTVLIVTLRTLPIRIPKKSAIAIVPVLAIYTELFVLLCIERGLIPSDDIIARWHIAPSYSIAT